MTTTTLTDSTARRESLIAYLSVFADGCTWQEFPTATVVMAGNTIGAIASDYGNGESRQVDYQSATAVLSAHGIAHCWDQAHDSAHGTDVFMFGASKPRR